MLETKATKTLLVMIQIALAGLFLGCTKYDSSEYSHAEYVIFRDIMVMLLLGFGFLMTFLRKYGLGAVGFTMMLTVIAIQLNIFIEHLFRFFFEGHTEFPIPISIFSFIDGEFSAATLLISYGAVIGRASPAELIIMALFQSVFYAFNKVVIVFGLLGVEDVGGTITIHMFGAYFGLAVSKALKGPKHSENADPNAVSDVLALIGTTLLWVYWPSFVGATESSNAETENLCIIHTILALLGSTISSFFISQQVNGGKFNPVHIANSTLAGGVAVGASARLEMTPGGSFLLGVLAGIVSVYGYLYCSSFLEDKFGLYDTCGVNNLHGFPSILGGLASVVFVAIDSDAEFLGYEVGEQMGRQVSAVFATLMTAVLFGSLTGIIMVKSVAQPPDDYTDALWWEGEYFEHIVPNLEQDASVKSRASAKPVDDNAV